LYCVRQERKKNQEDVKWDLQRRALGIKPGVGPRETRENSAEDDFTRKYNRARSILRKRCPRGVCTTPGASCPSECVEEPRVIRHNDGRRTHQYHNVQVCFSPDGKIVDLAVDDRTWS